jgi:A/G-specific adenine glycosylase
MGCPRTYNAPVYPFVMNHPRFPASKAHILQFRRRLLRWFERYKRDLPWRKDRDPYRVWLSEIMLQQTRVAAVLEHYCRFIEKFPTVLSLAQARAAAVLAAWSGLGYYRRARMLHRAAREIVWLHDGQFPETAAKWRDLPGVGRYTAAAIASICFGERVAVVDGSVARVLARVTGIHLSCPEAWQCAQMFTSPSRPGDFNQAIMELGSTVCLPRQPKCLVCPVFSCCATRGELPGSRSNKQRHARKETNYLFARRNGSVLLTQRPLGCSLMPGMWELPEIATTRETPDPWLTIRHSITTTNYMVRVIRGKVPADNRGSWIRLSRLAELPLTGLARKILRSAKLI